MIKIFDSTEKEFRTNGLGTIRPLSCVETKKISLNGWSVSIEVSTEYADLIVKDRIVLVETKEKGPQPFRIGDPEKKDRKISFTANHVLFDAERYMLADVRPTDLGPVAFVQWCNDRTDIKSPFKISGTAKGVATRYFIRKNLLEAFEGAQEEFDILFDVEGFNIRVLSPEKVGGDNGFSIVYGKNSQGVKVVESWSEVCTKILPVGSNELLLPELYLTSDISYPIPYTRTVSFNVPEKDENEKEYTLKQRQKMLRTLAKKYLDEHKYPQISYEIKADVPQELCINDVIRIKHPLCSINANVQAYTYNCISKKVKTITFGNYNTDVKKIFKSALSASQEETNRNTDIKISAYDESVQKIAGLIENSLGVFYTKKVSENGSYKYYLHNKPKLEESSTVWTIVNDALAVSTDGGKTWNAGIDSSGNAVVNVLNAIGINADWINAGTITGIRFNNGNGKFIVDADGNLYASNADITGAITSSSAKITGGSIVIDPGTDDVTKNPCNLMVQKGDGTFTRVGAGGIFYYQKSGDIYGESSAYLTRCRKVWAGKGYTSKVLGEIIVDGKEYSGKFGEYVQMQNLEVLGSLTCTGTKSRLAATENYNDRLMYCYELPSPLFGDVGEGDMDESGECIVYLDSIFAETVNTSKCHYSVFLTKYGEGDIWVENRSPEHFTVKGTPGLKFSWEIKAKQLNFEDLRLEEDRNIGVEDSDIENEVFSFLEREQEDLIDYE